MLKRISNHRTNLLNGKTEELYSVLNDYLDYHERENCFKDTIRRQSQISLNDFGTVVNGPFFILSNESRRFVINTRLSAKVEVGILSLSNDEEILLDDEAIIQLLIKNEVSNSDGGILYKLIDSKRFPESYDDVTRLTMQVNVNKICRRLGLSKTRREYYGISLLECCDDHFALVHDKGYDRSFIT